MNHFNQIIENKQLLRAIEDLHYDQPTEIQAKAIPLILNGEDLIAKSNTGTGKTASFGLPLLQMLSDRTMEQVLVVCPTRELALQVEEEIRKYCKYMEGLKVISVFGGVPIDRQIRALKKGVSVIVGTPGRIKDHIRRKTIKLSLCDCVVLDEADEMLNMGFREDIEFILDKAKPNHQTVLFSATMPKQIREIAKHYLKDQKEIEIKSPQKTVDTIDQVYYEVGRNSSKPEVLKKVLEYKDPKLSVIFCNTKAGVDQLAEDLNKDGVKVLALHGDIKQERRTKIMNNFKKATNAILVATDIAARGIDVDNIDLVVNYDLPQDNEIYIHRIGRTGRAGKDGQAISLVKGKQQLRQLQGISKFTKAKINEARVPSAEEIAKNRQAGLKQKIKDEFQMKGMPQQHADLIQELLAEGMNYDEIISSLLSIVNPTNAPVKKTRKKLKNGVEIKLTIGRNSNVTEKAIEEAILKSSSVDENQIGKIDLRKKYCIVNVEKKAAKQLLEDIDGSQIQHHMINARFYNKEKFS